MNTKRYIPTCTILLMQKKNSQYYVTRLEDTLKLATYIFMKKSMDNV